MKSYAKQWQQFNDSTVFEPASSVYHTMSESNSHFLMDLSPLSLFRISGDEAEDFLQGQLSNDLTELGPDQCQFHAYCNPKGRALALLRLMRHDNGFWMLVPHVIGQQLVTRLRMYVLRAKVVIEQAVDHRIFCLAGHLESEYTLPDSIERYSVDGIIKRQVVIVSTETDPAPISEICHRWTCGDYSTWRMVDILSGIPQVFAQTTEAFIPQMINLDLVNGVSFKKGCYPGQEIIARLRYLGKLKQRMLVGKIEDDECPGAGTPVFSEDKPNQKAGTIIDAVSIGKRQHIFTAMVPANSVYNGILTTGSADGPSIHRVPLPYEIPTDLTRPMPTR